MVGRWLSRVELNHKLREPSNDGDCVWTGCMQLIKKHGNRVALMIRTMSVSYNQCREVRYYYNNVMMNIVRRTVTISFLLAISSTQNIDGHPFLVAVVVVIRVEFEFSKWACASSHRLPVRLFSISRRRPKKVRLL